MASSEFGLKTQIIVREGVRGRRMEAPYEDKRVGMIASKLPGGVFRFIFICPPELVQAYRERWQK